MPVSNARKRKVTFLAFGEKTRVSFEDSFFFGL